MRFLRKHEFFIGNEYLHNPSMFLYIVHYIDIHTRKALQYDKDQVK